MEGERSERCETCRFWWQVTADTLPDKPVLGGGICRRYPPNQLFLEKVGTARLILNLTKPDDWCGEWRAKGGAEVTVADAGLLRLLAAVEWDGPNPSTIVLSRLLLSLGYRERTVVGLLYGLDGADPYTSDEVARILKLPRATLRAIVAKIGPKLAKLYRLHLSGRGS